MAKRPKQRTANVDGEKVKDLSIERGMNQKALAKAAGVSPRTLQRAERGERVRLDLIGNIANALQVQPSEIMLNPSGSGEDGSDDITRPGYQLIRLKRVKSARELTEMIVGTHEVIFESDVEVTASSAQDISVMMGLIEDVRSGEAGLVRTVREARGGQWLSVEPKSIQFLGTLQSSINSLGQTEFLPDENNTIGIFVGKHREIEGRVEPDETSPEAIQAPEKFTFAAIECLVVRFSRQQVGSFSYEVPGGLTETEADEMIQALKDAGKEVIDRRFFRQGAGYRRTAEEFDKDFEDFMANEERPKIMGRAFRERFAGPPFNLGAPTKGPNDDDEEGTNDDE